MAIPKSRRLDFTEIPVVDLSSLVAGQDDPAIIDALGSACRDIGFVYVENHGVDSCLIENLMAASREFFARSMDEKNTVVLNERLRGYLPLRYRSYEGEANAATSNQEGFWIGHERALDPGNKLDGPNVWPLNGAALREAMGAYFDATSKLAAVLQRAFSLALGQDADFFERLFNPPQYLLKLNHYPPQGNPQSVSNIGVVPHSDEGGFTILWQDDNGGLEIQSKNGEWVEAPPLAGTYIINLGNAMQTWTNGEFSSTPHRVINRSGADRYSIPLFANPRWDAPIKPLMGDAPVTGDADTYEVYQRRNWRRIFPIANVPE
jgi:isopenicillin N synthase-like dioxygenase